jgi:hypothetical protein
MPQPTGLLAVGPPPLAIRPLGTTVEHPGGPAIGPTRLGQMPHHALHQVTQLIIDPFNDEVNLKCRLGHMFVQHWAVALFTLF